MLTVSVQSGPPPVTLAAARLTHTWRDDAGLAYARARLLGETRWIEWDGVGTFRFRPPERTVDAWPAAGTDGPLARRTFERFLQPIVLQAFGFQTLHASAVLGPHGVIALCGMSGSGKSTLAFRLDQLGHPQIADDATVFSVATGGVKVHPLPFTSRLRPPALALLRPGAAARSLRDPVEADLPLAAVVILRQAPGLNADVRTERVPAHQAFAEVLTHAHAFDAAAPDEAAGLAHDYLALVDRVPVVRLTYLPDFSRLRIVVESILAVGGPETVAPARLAAGAPVGAPHGGSRSS